MAKVHTDKEDAVWRQMKDTGKLEGHRVLYLESAESTNSLAMALGKKNEAAGTIVVAETQTRGRGRLGRKWLSPPGTGLYCSVILRPNLAPFDLPKTTIAAGVAVCKAVEEITEAAPLIKWPNDLMLAGKKFGGILTETGECNGRGRTLVVLGIGVNVGTTASSFPQELRSKATSLAIETGMNINRGDLLREIVKQLASAVTLLEKGGFSIILQEFEQRDAVKGLCLNWLTPEGKVVRGVSLGLDNEGVLHIRDDAGRVHQVFSGDITLATK